MRRSAASRSHRLRERCRSRPRSAIHRCRRFRPPRRPAFQAQAWNAIFAPKGTSPIIAKLNAAAAKALDENVRKRLLDLGSVIPGPAERSPEALAALVKSEIAKWTPVLKPATN
jgi:hypothetical protein